MINVVDQTAEPIVDVDVEVTEEASPQTEPVIEETPTPVEES